MIEINKMNKKLIEKIIEIIRLDSVSKVWIKLKNK